MESATITQSHPGCGDGGRGEDILRNAIIFFAIALAFAAYPSAAPGAEGAIPFGIVWKRAGDAGAVVHFKNPSYLVDTSVERAAGQKVANVGALLDLKYFSGLNYDILRKMLPGRKINMTIFIPYLAEHHDTPSPDRIKFVLKSRTAGEWCEYYTGKEFISVRKAGYYNLELVVPVRPISLKGGKSFVPQDSVAVSIEYIRPYNNKSSEEILFLITNFSIDKIKVPYDKLRWQLTGDGNVSGNTFLPYFPEGSSLFMVNKSGTSSLFRASADGIEGYNLFQMSAFLTQDTVRRNGSFSLLLKDEEGERVLAAAGSDFSLSDKLNRVSLLAGLNDAKRGLEIYFSIKTAPAAEEGKLFFLTSPLSVSWGELVAFDSKWKVRDAQGLGGYKCVDISEEGGVGACNLTISEIGEGVYQTRIGMLLRGGIDWTNPFYRVELVRYFDEGPVDMSGFLLEVQIDPLTDTSYVWQKPYRARLGLIDASGSVIFGPNISISENMPATASVRATAAIPPGRGFTMPGFDPKKTAGILINIEASHETLDTKEIYLSLKDLTIRKMDLSQEDEVLPVDFRRFERAPEKWLLTGLIEDSGGFLVGINYPFPNVKVPRTDLEVPQVYPLVGPKPTAPYHLGISSPVTGRQMVSDFALFAEKGISLVRIFLLGDTTGIFMRDLYERDIGGFSEDGEALFSKAAGMGAEDLARFLSDNEKSLFKDDDVNGVTGLNPYVFKDMLALLDVLEESEKKTGRRAAVIMSLYDFMLGDDIIAEGPGKRYVVGEHPELVTDPLIRAKALAVTWKMMREMKRDPRFHRYVAEVEFINEPLNAVHFSSHRNFNKLVNFVLMGVYILKDALGDDIPVSVGFRCWLQDMSYWKDLADGVDTLLPHYWESLESYNINVPAIWPLDMPASAIWDYLGTSGNGRVTGIGEISPGKDPRRYLFVIEKAGYDLALLWSYSGHDGHDVKPYLDDIGRYQESNILIKKLQDMPPQQVSDADIKQILELKAAPATAENVEFIKRRVLKR